MKAPFSFLLPGPEGYWSLLFIPALLSYICMLQAQLNRRPTLGTLERLDASALAELLTPDAALEVIADGNLWAEGPVWVHDQEEDRGFLLWSDVKKNRIYRWEEGGGLFTIGKSIYLEPSGCRTNATLCQALVEPGSNGLTTEPGSGLLVMCEHGERRVSRLERNGTFTPLATHYQGKRLNSPNDLVFGPGGDLYFTDPPYGLNGKEEDPLRELDVSGVYRVPAASMAKQTTESGQGSPDVQLVYGGLKRPNGLAFSPDFKTLYVANSDADDPKWIALDMDPQTGLARAGSEPRQFASAKAFQKEDGSRIGNPDGLKVDDKGHLWATGPGGLLILSPQGQLLGTLLTGKKTANVAWGGDGHLYVCADDVVARIPVLARPAPPPPKKGPPAQAPAAAAATTTKGQQGLRRQQAACVGPDGSPKEC